MMTFVVKFAETTTSEHSNISDPSMSPDAARLIAQGVVASRLGYCNEPFHSESKYDFDRLQVVQYMLD
jgi:hypothetical protein